MRQHSCTPMIESASVSSDNFRTRTAATFCKNRWSFTRQPENSKRAHLRVPAFNHTTKIPRKMTPKKRRKNENSGWREKCAKFGPPTLRAPHPSGPPPFGAPTLRGPHPSGHQPSGHQPSGPPPRDPPPPDSPHCFWVVVCAVCAAPDSAACCWFFLLLVFLLLLLVLVAASGPPTVDLSSPPTLAVSDLPKC